MTATIIREFINADTDMKAMVVANAKAGFNVVVQDMDSGEYVPFVTTYPTLERAITEAAKI